MFGLFKKKQPIRVEHIGPDAPKIKINASIQAYSLKNGTLHMSLCIGPSPDGHVLSCPVPASVPTAYPIGTEIRLVVEKQ